MKLKDLFKDFLTWFKDDIVKKRIDNKEDGYTWVAKSLKYTDELELKKFQDFFDRKELNSDYKQKVEEKDISKKKAYAAIQTEVNLIYSFHKGFAIRNQTRLQAYRNDLSVKGKRGMSAINIGLGKFEAFKKTLEELK